MSKKREVYKGSKNRYQCECGFETDDFYEYDDHMEDCDYEA